MSRRFAVTVALVALASGLATPVLRAQGVVKIPPQTPFDRLYQDYAGGDFDVVSRTLTNARSVAVLQAPADGARLRKWLGKWDRGKAAFILEFAEAEAQSSPGAAITAISEGRLYLISRPSRLGESADEDAFELAWHKGAMALLEDRMFVSTQELYLDTLQRRYAPASGGGAIKIDPRFELERAVAQEQKCWNDASYLTTSAIAGLPSAASAASNPATQADTSSADMRQVGVPAGEPTAIMTRKDCLAEGARRYIIAALAPETASEAFTRSAWLQYQLGAHADALKTIERARPTEDVELTYWTNLFRGRILDALGRFADAEGAYRSALATRPGAQSAAVGLALTLFKTDRIADARAAAAEARRQSPDAVDPWWTYLGADARFLPRWRAELRRGVGKQ
jgi:tetratricopeptide (TPR) repeat protein